jgi:GAF domain-containing protein
MSSKFGKVLAAATSNDGDNSSLSGVVKQLRRVQMLDRFAARLKELAVQAQDAVSIDSAMNSSSILVAVRLRPFLPHDKTYDTKETCLEIEGNNIDIEDVRVEEHGHRESKPHHFKFDVFLPSNVTQQRVYVATAKRILVKVLKGYNGTIFTYGQTGSGKTHTMLGDDKDPGIIPRVGKDLMAEIKRMAGKTAFKVQASFVEIYREKIADLIAGVNDKQIQHDKDRNSQSSVLKAVAKMRRNSVEHRGKEATMKAASSFLRAHFHDHPEKKKKKKGQDLKVRESKHGVEIIGVSMHPVNSSHDIMYLLDLGNESRHVASHALNSASSRSHCIFTLYIEQSKVSASGQATRLKSKFNLIDLAGSERAERTGATGDLLKEGASINRSLSALGNVIKVLTDSKKKKKKGGKTHIPYRDSMLTRLLSDSLGGTASTLMCCNLAPGSDHYFETLSSLEFAKRVKKVKNTVTLRTEKLSQKEAKAMVKDADQVRQQMVAMQLEHQKQLQSKKLTLSSDATNELKLLRKEMEHHKKRNEALHKISKATAANDRSILSDEGQTTTKTITDSDFARLFFVNTDAHSMSYIDYDRSEPTFEIGRGIIGRVAQTGETMFAPMAPEHDLFDPAVDEGSLTPTDVVGPLLAVPIIDEDGSVIGVMATGRRPGGEPFSQDDALLLQSICQHIAHAVHSHDSAGKNGGKLTLTTLTVSEAGQKFHNAMMQIAAMCETRSKMAALTEELIEDMIGGAHGTLFFIGGAPDMNEDDKHVWSMHMNASPTTLITGMPGIVGDCVRSHETVNIATSNDHQEYHEKFDAHPHHSPGAASAHVHATMCIPIYKTMGEPSSGVLAAIRVMRSDATGAFGREDAAVIELLAPYVSSGLQRILKNDHHMRTSLQAAQQLEDMTSRMEEVHRDRDAQEHETQALQAEIRRRDEEMKQMNKDMRKVGIASGARSTLKLALEHKKASQAQAMQASLNAELEMMRQNKHMMEEEFEKAKNQLKKAEQGRKVLKKRHMSVKATQLFNAVDGKQKEKALLKAQLMTDLANKEKNKVQQKLSIEQAKTKRLQKAHELEVKKFHEEVKKHEEDLRKKKIALEKSMVEAKNKHAKKLVALKSKLRRFKSQSNMHQDTVKLERNRRLSMQLRNSFKDMKQSRLNETLETMEEELQKQQRRYNLGSVQEESDDDSNDDSDDDSEASHGSHRGALKQNQKSNQTRTPSTTHNRGQKRSNSPKSSNHKGMRQPLPPSKGFMNGPTVTNNNVSRHNKLLRGLMQMSPAKTRTL